MSVIGAGASAGYIAESLDPQKSKLRLKGRGATTAMNQICLRRRSCLGRMRRETNESRIRQQTRNMGGERVIGQHGGSRGLVNQVPDTLTGSPSSGTLLLRGIDGSDGKYGRLSSGSYGIALWAMTGRLLASRRGDSGLESVLGLTRALVAVVMVQGGWMRKRQ